MSVDHGFHATLTARPGKGDELVELPAERAVPARTRTASSSWSAARPVDPDVVHVTEGWTSEEAHGRFFATEEAQALVAKLGPLLAGESEYVDEVPVGGKAAF